MIGVLYPLISRSGQPRFFLLQQMMQKGNVKLRQRELKSGNRRKTTMYILPSGIQLIILSKGGNSDILALSLVMDGVVDHLGGVQVQECQG